MMAYYRGPERPKITEPVDWLGVKLKAHFLCKINLKLEKLSFVIFNELSAPPWCIAVAKILELL